VPATDRPCGLWAPAPVEAGLARHAGAVGRSGQGRRGGAVHRRDLADGAGLRGLGRGASGLVSGALAAAPEQPAGAGGVLFLRGLRDGSLGRAGEPASAADRGDPVGGGASPRERGRGVHGAVRRAPGLGRGGDRADQQGAASLGAAAAAAAGQGGYGRRGGAGGLWRGGLRPRLDRALALWDV
ncbi:MAG: NnrU family protein in cluster with Mesaconyl-CoA hydratase, partial [uncultured Rubellimicrobium sp.]